MRSEGDAAGDRGAAGVELLDCAVLGIADPHVTAAQRDAVRRPAERHGCCHRVVARVDSRRCGVERIEHPDRGRCGGESDGRVADADRVEDLAAPRVDAVDEARLVVGCPHGVSDGGEPGRVTAGPDDGLPAAGVGIETDDRSGGPLSDPQTRVTEHHAARIRAGVDRLGECVRGGVDRRHGAVGGVEHPDLAVCREQLVGVAPDGDSGENSVPRRINAKHQPRARLARPQRSEPGRHGGRRRRQRHGGDHRAAAGCDQHKPVARQTPRPAGRATGRDRDHEHGERGGQRGREHGPCPTEAARAFSAGLGLSVRGVSGEAG